MTLDYEHRTALDEVVQMMGGLDDMTRPEGRPLRAGTSAKHSMGGLFGAIGALAALHQRDRMHTGTGQGSEVQSALFENNVLPVARHMMPFAVTGRPAAPIPSRISAWSCTTCSRTERRAGLPGSGQRHAMDVVMP